MVEWLLEMFSLDIPPNWNETQTTLDWSLKMRNMMSGKDEWKAITTKWVYRIETNAGGSTPKLKAKLVTKGFQKP